MSGRLSSEAQELEQVRDRIVELEKLLEQKKKPPGTPIGMVVIIMGGFLVTFGAMLATSIYITVGRTLLEEKLSPKPPTPVVATGPTNDLFPLPKTSPTIGAHINNDATEDFIAVFRNANYGGVDVVAVDGSSYKPLWHSGPYTLQVNDSDVTILKRVNQSVVLANGSNLWVINIKNGYLERGLDGSSKVRNICPSEDGVSKALLDNDEVQTLDLTTSPASLTTPANFDGKNRSINCDQRGPFPLCNGSNSFPCEKNHTPHNSNIMPGSSITYEDETNRFAVTRGGKGTGSFSAAFSYKSSTSVVWQREICAEGDEDKFKDQTATTFAGGRLLFGYRVDPTVKVQAHGADGRAWLYQNNEGRSLKSLSGTATRAYVMLDDRLVVLAANGGNVLATIRSMP